MPYIFTFQKYDHVDMYIFIIHHCIQSICICILPSAEEKVHTDEGHENAQQPVEEPRRTQQRHKKRRD